MSDYKERFERWQKKATEKFEEIDAQLGVKEFGEGDADLLAQPFRPVEVRVSLVHADHVVVAQFRSHPLAHAPHAAAIGPDRGAGAAFKSSSL